MLSGEVEIEKIEKCDDASNKITSTTLCAGPYFVNGCETDDGSPMICNNKLHGLINFRPLHYCSAINPNRLGTYIDLSVYYDWIAEYSGSGNVFLSLTIVLSCFIIVITN